MATKNYLKEAIVIDKFNETSLLRMTKDELIDHIIQLYEEIDAQSNALSEWWAIVDLIKQNERFKDLYDNV